MTVYGKQFEAAVQVSRLDYSEKAKASLVIALYEAALDVRKG